MTINEKIKDKFSEDRLRLYISAIAGQEELKMRNAIEKCLSLYPIKGKKIAFESGTYHGLSAALLAEYFDIVYTCDIEKGYYVDNKIKYEIWDLLGVTDKIKFKMLKNDNEKPKFIEECQKENPISFCFIDGNHAVGTEIDFKLLNKCGRILFHDYNKEKATNNQGMWKAVYDFINTLKQNIVYINEPFVVWIKK